MNLTERLKLKCSSLNFSELESLRNLTNNVYDKLIGEATDKDGAESYREELNQYINIINDVIEQRVVCFFDI